VTLETTVCEDRTNLEIEIDLFFGAGGRDSAGRDYEDKGANERTE
jgi:hypothetical protein